MFIATLIAKDRLSAGEISTARDLLPSTISWIEANKACDLMFAGDPKTARNLLEGAIDGVDIIIQKQAARRRKLIIADMDSTMITVECIDELADYAGIKPQIAAITEAAMRGELNFEAALRSRVALLKGLPVAVIEQCLRERVVIMPGARTLVRTLKAGGGGAVLVSGGFTRFADPVGVEIGFDRVIANNLGISNGILDGTVTAPIIGADSKLAALNAALAEKGWDADAALAVGDGANDIPMIAAAGLGVAYHAKPATRAASSAAVIYGDLSVILYAMGYPKSEWVEE